MVVQTERTPARVNYCVRNVKRKPSLAEKSEYNKGYDDGVEEIIRLIQELHLAGDYAEILIAKIQRELEKEQ